MANQELTLKENLVGFLIVVGAVIGISHCETKQKEEDFKNNGYDLVQNSGSTYDIWSKNLGDTAIELRYPSRKANEYKVFDFKNQKIEIQHITEKRIARRVTENIQNKYVVSMTDFKNGRYIEDNPHSSQDELMQEYYIAENIYKTIKHN